MLVHIRAHSQVPALTADAHNYSRHSLAPGGLNPPSPMRYSATPDDITADFQHKLSIEGERAVPFEFAEQYGPMIADANVVVTSRGGPRGRAADGKPAHGVHGSGRRRSLSAVSQLSNGEGPYVAYVREPASPLGIITAAGTIKGGELPQTVMEEGETALRGQEWLAVVEFRAGRKDYFYLPVCNVWRMIMLVLTLRTSTLLYICILAHQEEAPFTVAIGDLVIVEADRGQDLGKVVRLNVTASDAMYESSVSTTATPTTPTAPTPKRIIPKRIVRHAEPSAVKQLVEKARDEKKCLAVVQAKIRQKGMNLEVVDAEYQWDRHKLIFYYVAEERVDFRELVKDLFKIYKTRIWMSAVDRR